MPKLDDMMKRQKMLAEFGEFAINSENLDAVLTEACRLVGEATGTGRAKVLEIQKGWQELLVRAGVGWAPGVVGTARLQMGERSSETYAIKAARPIVTQNIATDDRFDVPHFMKQAGVVAFVNVPIFVPGQRPYGVLQIDDTKPREFGGDEIEFLQTYAMILGPVIDRLHLVKERERDQEVIRTSEVRHRLLIESWAQAVWETDADGVVIADSPSWRTYTGQTLEAWLGYGWLGAIHPDDRAYAEHQWREALAARSLVNAEFRLRSSKGGWRWTNVRAAPVFDDDGNIEKWAGLNIDIDATKRADAALRQREAELARVQRIGGVGGLDIDVASGLTGRRSPEYLRLHGLDSGTDHSPHAEWRARVHHDDVEAAEHALFAAIESGSVYESEYRIIRPNDGAIRWIAARADIERDEDGRPLRLVGAHIDVTEQKELQERQSVLVNELQHRTRNLIAVVSATAEQTARASNDLADFAARFGDRLAALARVQGLLSRIDSAERVTFDQLIQAELSAINNDPDRVTVDGPSGVPLRSSTVQTLAMAIHELATNALKYGALGQPSARLTITWSHEVCGKDDKPWLHIDWRETGVEMPTGTSPQGSGHGRQLIERALPYQLDAETSYVLGTDGVRCKISVPVSMNVEVE